MQLLTDTLFTFIPMIFWGFIIFGLIKFANKNLYKPLAKFTTLNKMPTSAIRIPQFSFKNTKLNNAVKIAESNQQLCIKLPIIKQICIPMNDFASVKVETGAFKKKTINITFKDKNIPKISFSLNPNQLSQFPHLMRFADEAIELKTDNILNNKITKNVVSNTQKMNQMGPMLGSTINNSVRALLFILGLMLAGYIFTYYY